jgi:hypothetical protein
MKRRSEKGSARAVLACIYEAVSGHPDGYIAVHEALFGVQHFNPPPERHLAALAEAGCIRMSREGDHLTLTVRGKSFIDGNCTDCGCDMRASPQRCPECGAISTPLPDEEPTDSI